MVLVFKTTVDCEKSAKKLAPLLDQILIKAKWSFDLDDCDKVLRIESSENTSDLVIRLMNKNGFLCEELRD